MALSTEDVSRTASILESTLKELKWPQDAAYMLQIQKMLEMLQSKTFKRLTEVVEGKIPHVSMVTEGLSTHQAHPTLMSMVSSPKIPQTLGLQGLTQSLPSAQKMGEHVQLNTINLSDGSGYSPIHENIQADSKTLERHGAVANVEIVETSFMGHSNNCPSKADDVQLEGTGTIIPNFHSEIEEKEDDDVFLEPGRVVEGPAEVSGCGEKMMIEDGQSSLMRDALFPMRQKESLTEIRRAVKNKLSLSAVKDTEDTIWEL